jgi:isopentenyl-diphosphate delta-isomerase
MNIDPTDEYLDIVDTNDYVIGTKRRSEIYALKMSSFRVINLFIKNTSGQLWIPRRAATKRIFPLCLDVSMGGHVESGETYFEALSRELKEELNMEIRNYQYSFLGKLTPHGNNVSAFMKVYEIQSNKSPDYNKKDFVDSQWLFPAEVINMLRHGDNGKDDLIKLITHFYVLSTKREIPNL